jgi:hypothetical protein
MPQKNMIKSIAKIIILQAIILVLILSFNFSLCGLSFLNNTTEFSSDATDFIGDVASNPALCTNTTAKQLFFAGTFAVLTLLIIAVALFKNNFLASTQPGSIFFKFRRAIHKLTLFSMLLAGLLLFTPYGIIGLYLMSILIVLDVIYLVISFTKYRVLTFSGKNQDIQHKTVHGSDVIFIFYTSALFFGVFISFAFFGLDLGITQSPELVPTLPEFFAISCTSNSPLFKAQPTSWNPGKVENLYGQAEIEAQYLGIDPIHDFTVSHISNSFTYAGENPSERITLLCKQPDPTNCLENMNLRASEKVSFTVLTPPVNTEFQEGLIIIDYKTNLENVERITITCTTTKTF